jgi:hypothetical protein
MGHLRVISHDSAASRRHPGTGARTLDFSQPVAVTLLMILHAIGNGDDPHGLIGKVMQAVPSGSYLAITHWAADIEAERMAELSERLNRLSFQQYSVRDHADVARFFDGLDLVEPGVVSVEQWHPAVATGTWSQSGPGWDANPERHAPVRWQ